jgi:phosphate-selective porin OprO/OprP
MQPTNLPTESETMNDNKMHGGPALLAVLALALPVASHAVTAKYDPDYGLRVRSDDRSFKATLAGRVHLDSAWYSDDVTLLEDDTVFRRARASLALEYGRRWSAFADHDFGNVVDGWKNAWLQYRFSDDLSLRVGSQTVPFGMADYESSDNALFMERPLPMQLAPGLRTGALLRGSARSMAWSVGVFGNDLEDDDRRQLDGTSYTGRFTFTPLRRRSNLVHVGASAEYRSADSGAEARFRARPESYATDARLIDTRTLTGADDLLTLGVEAAWAHGPVLVLAEYLASELGRESQPDASFSGWYASAGWVVTGERHRYNRKTGVFGALKPRGDWGAVELAARISTLDLNDGLVTGGEQTNLGLGVNWYWTDSSRLMLNYLWMDAEPNRDGVDESPNAVQLRLQVGF